MTAVAYVAASALFTTGGVLLLRSSLVDVDDLSFRSLRSLATDPAFVAGFLLYAMSFLTWLLALRRYEAARIFPAFVSAGYVGVLLGGYLFLGESLGASRLAGIAVILVGIALVAR
jgi:multidrug transporter EmrE-like cation transporter